MQLRQMMKIGLTVFFFAVFSPYRVWAGECSPMVVTSEHKCPACGMRVASFENWHTQIVYGNGSSDAFCGVKCLMAFYFEPSKYSGKDAAVTSKTLFAKDYYTQQWHDMEKMVFVMGSDVMGPMGKDLVPFTNPEHAKTFLQDHNGARILNFDEITLELIQGLRNKKHKAL